MIGSQRKYWIGFSRAAGIGAVRLRALLDHFGDIEAAWFAEEPVLRQTGIGPHAVGGLLEARRSLDLDGEVDRLDHAGFDFLTWDDETFPPPLLEIASPPIVLYRWGALRPDDRYAVALVGTRRPTAYGQAVARDVATALAVHGVTVISGLARGVDSIAHRAALDAGGRTLAVLGSGLDEIYPPEHRSLAQEIAGQGALLTEYPLGVRPEAGNFPVRNRIVAGLARAVVVVEAGEASGALITADFAADQGRDVFAVPGSIYSRASRGTNRLLLTGATPLTSPEDVLEALRVPTALPLEEENLVWTGGELEMLLAGLLSDDPIHADDLVARTRRTPSEVMAALAMLELQGRAVQVGGMNYVSVRRPRRVAEVGA
ncbi:MAG TPA: DNA-processing protein DprA [Anaerolineales bacterium]|nr:DNA-processing protein DprA [Anaerolineales bacterium]